MTVRLAWDGQYYTKTDFLLWYGRERGLDLWDEAGASFATPGGCIRSQMLIANSEPQEVEKIIISFILISGEKACKDLVVMRGPCTSAKHLRDHLRMHSSEDDMRILDWDSALMIDGQIIDLGSRDVFVLDTTKTMLERSPGFLCLSVVRKPLWGDDEFQ